MQLNHALMNDQRKNVRDRELFSELIEPQIHLHLIQVVPPFLEESNPVYIIQMRWSSLEMESVLLANLVLRTMLNA